MTKNNKTQQPAAGKELTAGKELSLDQTISLNSALSSKGLKAKNVSGENYLRIINLKTLMRNELKKLDGVHQQLAAEFEMEPVGPGQYRNVDKEKQAGFLKRVMEVDKSWKSPELQLNFIPEKELRDFCHDQDVEIESILFEYLLLEEVKK